MVVRTAFEQLNHSAARLVATVTAMAVIFILPPISAIAGLTAGNAPLALLGGGRFAGNGFRLSADASPIPAAGTVGAVIARCRTDVHIDDCRFSPASLGWPWRMLEGPHLSAASARLVRIWRLAGIRSHDDGSNP